MSQPNQTYRQRQAQTTTGPDSSQQPTWTQSQYSNGTQNSHLDIVGAMPSAVYASQPHALGLGIKTHQRVPSASLAVGGPSRMYTNYTHPGPQHDPFMHPPISPTRPHQPLIAPPDHPIHGFNGAGGLMMNHEYPSPVLSHQLAQNPGAYQQSGQGYHQGFPSSHLADPSQHFGLDPSLHDPRLVAAPPLPHHHHFAPPPPPMSQHLWGNVG